MRVYRYDGLVHKDVWLYDPTDSSINKYCIDSHYRNRYCILIASISFGLEIPPPTIINQKDNSSPT